MVVDRAKGESNFGKIRPFRRGKYFDKVIFGNYIFEVHFKFVIRGNRIV